MDDRRRRLVTFAVVAVAFGLLAAVQVIYFERGIVPGDAFVYLAAGERLNAGHELYALTAGDRPVDINPPYWTVPLVSPPPIAVLWRPLAALPSELGVWLWYAAQLTALGSVLAMLLQRIPLLTAAAMIVLLIPTVYEIGVGNVNSFLLLGLVLVWRLTSDERAAPAGVIAAVMTAVKVTPGILGWWLLAGGHRRGFAGFIVGGLGALLVSVLGAGFDSHLEYLRILSDRSAVGVSPLSLGGMAVFLGLPTAIANVLPALVAGLGFVLVWQTRDRPSWSFRIAVVTMIVGSPAVSINWYVLLYATLAPIAWPWRAQAGDASGPGVLAAS